MTDASKTSSPTRTVAIGEIVGTHGLRGWLRLRPYSTPSDSLLPNQTIHLSPVGRDGAAVVGASTRTVKCVRPHGRVILIQLTDLTCIEDAAPLVGAVLSVSENDLPALRPGEFYVYQLEGLEVLTSEGNRLGTVASSIPTGSNEVLVVRDGSREHLIPVIADVIRIVDLEQRRMVIDAIPGLLEI